MAVLARAALSSFLLQPIAVSSIRTKRDGPIDNAACDIPDFVFDLLRGTLNSLVVDQLLPEDPLEETLTRQWDADLLFCNSTADLDINLSLSGLGDSNVGALGCQNFTCLEDGFFSCQRSVATFTASMALGNVLESRGTANGDFSLCALNLTNTSVGLGFDIHDAKFDAELVVEIASYFPFEAKITKVNALDMDWGQAQNYNCDFTKLPEWLASGLPGFCEKVMEWSVTHLYEGVLTKLNGVLADLVNQLLVGNETAQQ